MQIIRSAGIYKALGAEFLPKVKIRDNFKKLIKAFEQTSVNISSNASQPLRAARSPEIKQLREFFESKITPELPPVREGFKNFNKLGGARSAPIISNPVNPFRAALMTGVFGLSYQRSISADNKETWIKPTLTPVELEKSMVHITPRPQYKIYGETILKVDFNKSNPAEKINTYGHELSLYRNGYVSEKAREFSMLEVPLTGGFKS